MFAGKPIIGIVGGIGSGKSYVSRLFGEMGCLVIDADELVREVYQRPEVKHTLVGWWGAGVLDGQGRVDRAAIARRVFAASEERRQLEGLVHPLVGQIRDQRMAGSAADPRVAAYVWDTPLLIEAGLAGQCDAVVFVEAPEEERYRRVRESRGWSREEWARREKLQLPLDKKRRIANDMVCNTADADYEVRGQVREVLSRILAGVRR
jgi:dephospho-CoA kinase